MEFLKVIVALLVLMAQCGPEPYVVRDGRDIVAVLEGSEWDWAGSDGMCTDNPHTISFNAERTVMTIAFRKPFEGVNGEKDSLAVYDIRAMSASIVTGFMRGEMRRTTGDELVVWDLVLTTPDEYRWHQTDWPPRYYTGAIRRCPS